MFSRTAQNIFTILRTKIKNTEYEDILFPPQLSDKQKKQKKEDDDYFDQELKRFEEYEKNNKEFFNKTLPKLIMDKSLLNLVQEKNIQDKESIIKNYLEKSNLEGNDENGAIT
jgi:hypothetical protein